MSDFTNPSGQVPNPEQPPQPLAADRPIDPTPAVPVDVAYGLAEPASSDVLVAERSGGSHKRRNIIIAAVSAFVLVVGGGVAFAAYSALSGGGSQPEEHVPSTAVAFVKIDADPSAGQKIDAARFLNKLSGVKGQVSTTDPIDSILSAVLHNNSYDINYATDIKPWLGRRAAVAVVPEVDASATPDVEGVVAVTDANKASGELTKIQLGIAAADGGSSSFGFVITDGYAIIAKDKATAQRLSDAAAKSSLSSSSTFSSDTSALGPTGVALGWVDLHGLAQLGKAYLAHNSDVGNALNASGLVNVNAITGREAFVVRFDPSYVELDARTFGTKPAATKPAPTSSLLSTLPEDTIGALSINGGSDAVAKAWTKLQADLSSSMFGTVINDELAQVEAQYGIAIPADIETLLGSQFVVAVGGTVDSPQFGVRSVTNPSKGAAVLAKLNHLLVEEGQLGALSVHQTSDGVAAATTPEYASEMAANGTLGKNPDFTTALPDVSSSSLGVWVNLRPLVASDAQNNGGSSDLQGLTAFGLTAGTGSDGNSQVRMRLVAS